MTDFLDLSILEKISSVITMLFVWVLLFGVFQWRKFFGDGKSGLHALIAFLISVFVLFAGNIREMIAIMVPWFVILFIVVMFIIIGVKMLGVSDTSIASVVTSKEYSITYWIITIVIIIVLFAFSQVFGQTVGPFLSGETADSGINDSYTEGEIPATGTGDFNSNLSATLFNPKILGFILIMLIASFAIRLLAAAPK